MKCEFLVKDGARFMRRCKREGTDVGPDGVSHLCAWHRFGDERAKLKKKALGVCESCDRFLASDGRCLRCACPTCGAAAPPDCLCAEAVSWWPTGDERGSPK